MPSADFPDVNTGAIRTLAADLQTITSALADVGHGTENVRNAVLQSEQWQGEAAQRWHAVVTDRVGDAGLTNETMGAAGSLLAKLAADLEDERRTYDRLADQYSRPENPRFFESGDPQVYQALCASAGRATELLDNAGKDLLGLAIIAGDIHARPAADRTPGVPAGADRRAASMQLLAVLFGSIRDNQVAGSKFEATVLDELGLSKNTDVWRPDPAFEGKFTAGGLPKGTIPDADEPGFLLEIKGTNYLSQAFQLRLEAQYARLSGRPLWIIKRAGANASDNVVRAAEDTEGGVIYRIGPNQYEDGAGNPVRIRAEGDGLTVNGYANVDGQPGGSDHNPLPLAGPDEPAAPVDPAGSNGPGAADPVGPEDPEVPDVPVDPIP